MLPACEPGRSGAAACEGDALQHEEGASLGAQRARGLLGTRLSALAARRGLSVTAAAVAAVALQGCVAGQPASRAGGGTVAAAEPALWALLAAA
eukprot:1267993-Lingulodinium_polyedra.AAC.1